MLRRGIVCALFSLLLVGCSDKSESIISIIPEPSRVVVGEGKVRLSGCDFKVDDQQMEELVRRFKTRMSLPIDGDGVMMKLRLNDSLARDEYHIMVCDTAALLEAGYYSGIMYGLITLEQIYNNRTLPKIEIWDMPRFEYRGFMLDVSRHFRTVDEVKKVLDMLAYHKINKFHWHLTDGIGWRIESKRYPLLTERGAWRRQRHNEAPWARWELSTADDSLAVGGFYTQEQIREIVAYADSKYIEVIPEIEMPGHSDAVLECYPNLKCDGAEGRSGEFCAGKEETYEFLTNVLDEVIGLFPSKYIHVGGDEVSHEGWANCPTCKAKMAKEKIGVDQLQGYFLGRIKTHLAERDKIVCGWDEIVNSGADSSIVVYSWTGWENGLKAAENGNKVVMCPLDYVYFDHYQGKHKDEPQAWGGMNNLERVYSFPVIPEQASERAAKNIIGGQANLWTENIATFEHLQYMMLPRLAALSEALWSEPANRNWNHFKTKLGAQIDRYRALKYHYSTSPADVFVSNSWVDDEGNVNVNLSTELKNLKIHYTTDGTVPTANSPLYDTTILIEDNLTLMAAAFTSDSIVGRVMMFSQLKNLASGKPVKYNTKYSKEYSGGGDKALTDAVIGFKRGDDPAWQGFDGVDFNVVIDLEQQHTVSQVSARFFQHLGSTSVVLPKTISVSVSDDGTNWKKVASQEVGRIDNFDAMIFIAKLEFVPVVARYVRVEAINVKRLPPWHIRRGSNAWVFVDEISIN